MFKLENILNLFNIICIFGFLFSGISGIITFSQEHHISVLLISINSILLTNILIYLEFLNYKQNIINFYSIRGSIISFYGLLLIGINIITSAFGVLSIFIGLTNILIDIFKNKYSIEVSRSPINENFINEP